MVPKRDHFFQGTRGRSTGCTTSATETSLCLVVCHASFQVSQSVFFDMCMTTDWAIKCIGIVENGEGVLGRLGFNLQNGVSRVGSGDQTLELSK